eukprot:m.128046 g.128046  ORF g.128046 m.128046 type:complete len:813 (+) comp29310_c0_seq1:313-2751(+)
MATTPQRLVSNDGNAVPRSSPVPLSTPRRNDGDNSPTTSTPSSSYKDEKKRYNEDKAKRKKKGPEVSTALPPMKEGSLKIRSLMKTWHKFHCKLYPGQLQFYSDNSAKKWMGTIRLFGGEVIERPTKKQGFGFKYVNKKFQNIYEQRGPRGEMFFNIHILPNDYCIMRTVTPEERKSWLAAIQDAIDAVLQQELTLNDTMHDSDSEDASLVSRPHHVDTPNSLAESSVSTPAEHVNSKRRSQGDVPDAKSQNHTRAREPQQPQQPKKSSVGARHVRIAKLVQETEFKKVQSRLPPSQLGFSNQRFQLGGEAQSYVWSSLSNVKPGGLLSPADTPTPFLGSRSYLEAMADPFTYCALLHDATTLDDAKERMLKVAGWFFASLSCKTQGLPIPPIQGEVYRCAVDCPGVDNLAYVIAEQIPGTNTSAVMAQNREAGWVVDASLTRSQHFYGWGMAVVDAGKVRVTLLGQREQYIITMPRQEVRGIAIGRLVWEYAGTASIVCEKTDMSLNIKFNRAFHMEDDGEAANLIAGDLLSGGVSVGTMSGQWDNTVTLAPEQVVVFANDAPTLRRRSPLLVVDPKNLKSRTPSSSSFFDSQVTWKDVVNTLQADKWTEAATMIKQLHAHSSQPEKPTFFVPMELDDESERDAWVYKDNNLSPWNAESDFYVTSLEGVVRVLRRDDPIFKGKLDKLEGTVALPPTASSSPLGKRVSKKASSSSAKPRRSNTSGGDSAHALSPIAMEGLLGDLDDDDEEEAGGVEISSGAVVTLQAENEILRKRIQALEREQGYLFQYYMPLWAILLFLMTVLWQKLPVYF